VSNRKTGELHVCRWSSPEIRYFITMCTSDHGCCLNAPSVQGEILDAVKRSDTLGDTDTFAFVVMPDHIHWLVRLGHRLSLGRTIARLKAESRLGLAGIKMRWQRDFFEHRLRAEESAEDYGRYVFLNPYRAGLLELNGCWGGWWCPRPNRFEFLGMLNADGSVPREWITSHGDTGEREIHTGRE
jgi:REP element-mobilizing transposase RayT